MAANPKTLGTAPSMKAAASICGISVRAVQAAKSAGCPAIRNSGRVDCDALMTWLGDHPEVLTLAGEAVNRDTEITLKIRAERLLREHALAVKRKEYVSNVEVEQSVASMIGNAKKVLLAGPSRLAPQVVGVSIPEAQRLIAEWLHEAMAQLHADPLGTEASRAAAVTENNTSNTDLR